MSNGMLAKAYGGTAFASIFMHTGTQRKNVSKADECPARKKVRRAFPFLIIHGHSKEKCQQS
jgi:hypothetical protein